MYFMRCTLDMSAKNISKLPKRYMKMYVRFFFTCKQASTENSYNTK